jgi:hypothetical protein
VAPGLRIVRKIGLGLAFYCTSVALLDMEAFRYRGRMQRNTRVDCPGSANLAQKFHKRRQSAKERSDSLCFQQNGFVLIKIEVSSLRTVLSPPQFVIIQF